MDTDDRRAAKKARLDPDESGMDMSEIREGYKADHTADEEEVEDDVADETEEDEEEDQPEVLEVEEPEEAEPKEDHDEALDNGDDSE